MFYKCFGNLIFGKVLQFGSEKGIYIYIITACAVDLLLPSRRQAGGGGTVKWSYSSEITLL